MVRSIYVSTTVPLSPHLPASNYFPMRAFIATIRA
jgi:hypothetical protein